MGKDIDTSSWVKGGYNFFFYGLVRGLRPEVCVELGTYAGYSAYWMGLALKHNGSGKLDCYDLWGKYLYNHVDKKVAEENLKGLPVNLHQGETSIVYAHHKPNSVNLLVIDISNDGFIYKKYLYDWYDKLALGAIVLMEGGIKERDRVGWMIKYKKEPIQEALKDKFIVKHYNFYTLLTFPGLTIFTRKEDPRFLNEGEFETDLNEG